MSPELASPKIVTPTGCCPPFDPFVWEGKELTWDHKLFLRDHVTSFFHVPLNMGRRITKDMAMIEAAGAAAAQPLMLADDSSPWGSELFIDITKPVPGARMDTLTGTFLTRVFEGPYSQMGAWAEQMKTFVHQRGRELDKLYFAYVMCPACAKAYGKNYVIGFAQVHEAPRAQA
ncbi:MAG: hydrolase [Myxococcota bacterium]